MSTQINLDASGNEIAKETFRQRQREGNSSAIRTIVGDGSHTVQFDPNGGMHYSRAGGISHDTVKNALAPRSIVDTVRNSAGSMVTNRAPSDSDTIKIGKMTTSVGSAVRNGFVTRNADGSLSDAQSAPQSFNQAPSADPAETQGATEGDHKAAEKEAETSPEAFTLGDEGEALLSEIVSTYDQSATTRAMDEIIQRGKIDEKTIARIATQAGQEPEAVSEKLNHAHAAFYEAAMARLEDQGVIDEEAFTAFLGDNPSLREETMRGVRSLVMSNDTAGLDSAAEAFKGAVDRYLPAQTKAALDEAGIPHRHGADGGLLVKLDGIEMSFSVAYKQGMFSVGPA